MNAALERRLLQAVIAIAGFVPVGAGLWGALGRMGTIGSASASEARYLSGLLLGIGLVFWACIPTIERRGAVVRALAAIVAIGGLARVLGALQTGFPSAVVLPLVMELGVTPAIALWRERVERRLAR
ncbi:MAG TPA: DUF4345 family protein [Phenylobacterium sp.]|nr:DUF4345 family protein [Phenylobacterium sp.]